MTQVTVIQGGNFSASGNFSAYNIVGDRIHVSARQMTALGLTADSTIPFPLYATVISKEFDVLDADKKPTGTKFTRQQAGALFLNREDAMTAVNADPAFAIEAAAQLSKLATTAGITAEQMTAIVTQSVL